MFRILLIIYSFLIIPHLFSQRGQVSFDLEFGEPSTKEEFLDVATFTNEPNNQLILGNKMVPEQGKNFIWLLKVDQDGEEVWSLNLSTEKELFALQIEELSDGFAILAGDYSQEQPIYRFTGQLHLLKINFEGDIQWQRTMAPPSFYEFLKVDEAKENISVLYKEGNAHRTSYNFTYDTNGNVIANYDFDSKYEYLKEFIIDSENEHLIGFTDENLDSYFLEKRSPTGELIWATTPESPNASNRKIYSLFYHNEKIVVIGHNSTDDFLFIATYNQDGEFLNEIILEGEAAEYFSTTNVFPNEEGYLSFTGDYYGFRIVQINQEGNFLWKRDDYSFPEVTSGLPIIRYDDNTLWTFVTTSFNQEKETDGWLMKIDANWNEVTTKTFGTPGPFHQESIFQVATTSDCGFITVGGAFSITQSVLSLQKWNYAGELQWTHHLPFKSEAKPLDLRPLDDDNIQLTYARRSQHSDTMGIVKKIFNIHTWETETQFTGLFESEYSHLADFQYTSDGGALVLLKNQGLLKLGASGARQWKTEEHSFPLAKTFEEWDDGFYITTGSRVFKVDKFTGAVEEFYVAENLFAFTTIGNMIKIPEGGYLMGIRVNTLTKAVIKLDDNFEEEWRHIFTGIDGEPSSNHIFVEYGGERQFWVHYHRGIPTMDISGDTESGLLILNQFGFIYWDKADWNEENMDVVDWTRDYDGGFIFVGNVYKTHSHDYKIIKTDGVGDLTNQAAYNFPELRIFPNPVDEELNLYFESAPIDNVEVNFYNYLGYHLLKKEIEVCGDVRQYKIPISNLPSGAIVLEIQIEGKTQTKIIYKNKDKF